MHLTHYCPADGTREVSAEYRADAEEYRGECDECGNAVLTVVTAGNTRNPDE